VRRDIVILFLRMIVKLNAVFGLLDLAAYGLLDAQPRQLAVGIGCLFVALLPDRRLP